MERRDVWVACVRCGAYGERDLNVETIRQNAPGEVLPVSCQTCHTTALVMTRPPWVLNETDRQFLRCQKIRPD